MKCFLKVLFVFPVMLLGLMATFIQLPYVACIGLLNCTGCVSFDLPDPLIVTIMEFYEEL